MKEWMYGILEHRPFIWLLFIVNVAGTIYGFVWYQWQLVETPVYFLPFVPDSPTASLFFVFVLAAFLLRKNWPLVEALAAVTLFKYGIWAVGMNIAGGVVTGTLQIANYMLIFSHLGMAIQGLLYTPYYRIKSWHLVLASIWVLHNEIIDYVFGMMPRYPPLTPYMSEIGYITFWLSLLSILIVYLMALRHQNQRELR
jgi:uncharacterized membrane protein YpjA